MEVALLGGFTVGGTNLAPLSAAGERVVAMLGLEAVPIRRPLVAGRLWSEKREVRALANLRSTLWRLRQGGLDVVVEDELGALALTRETVIDVHSATMAAAGRRRAAVMATERESEQLLTDLLPDWTDPWVRRHRNQRCKKRPW